MKRQMIVGLMSVCALVGLFPMVGCQTDGGTITDWTPMIRALDAAVNDYIVVKFPEPTPEQALVMSVKAIALEAIIIAMQRNHAPAGVIAEARAKADAAYGPDARAVRTKAQADVEESDVREALAT